MLEVVEHEQEPLRAEERAQVVEQRPARRLRDSERLPDRRQHELWIGKRRERDEVDTVSEVAGEGGCGAERESCLSCAARPGEREQPNIVAAEAFGYRR